MAAIAIKRLPISVILPTYQRAWSIESALNSVLTQSILPSEIIVVDDGSTDETQEILSPFKSQGVRVIQQDNRGVAAARNLGISNSSQSWIAFLDSDDQWHNKKLERQWDFHCANPEILISQCREVWIRNGLRVNPPKHLEKVGGDIFSQSLKNCMITPSSVLIQKKLFVEVGFFDEAFLTCEDFELWLRITSKYPIGLIEDYLLTRFGGHDDQLSNKYPIMDIYRIEAILKLLENGQLSQSQIDEACNNVTRKMKIVGKGATKRKNAKVLEKISNFSLRFDSLI